MSSSLLQSLVQSLLQSLLRSPARRRLGWALLVLGLPVSIPAPAQQEQPAADRGAVVGLDLRYRYEHVDDAGFDTAAAASLLRSRLFLESAEWRGFRGRIEVDDVRNIGPDDYNSTENGLTRYPVIADPQGTDINEAWLRYGGSRATGTVGRQRIRIGNQRFIGTKPWRQNEQTYDGARLLWSPIAALELDASYVFNVSRIFGPDDGANPADLKGDNLFLRVDYRLRPDHTLSGFAFLLDFDRDNAFPAASTVNNSSDTYGLEYQGSFDRLELRASWATQESAGDSELDYSADYFVVELAARLDLFTIRAAVEVLGGDDEAGFATPLAAAHGVQGWADKFIATPIDGIEDTWIALERTLGPFTFIAAFHDFKAEASAADFGSEIDLLASWKLNRSFSVEAKYASFDSADSDRYNDTDKAWLTLRFTL